MEETQRLSALHRYAILDTPQEKAFDDIAALAAQLCGTPWAFIALVDESRKWFKAVSGSPFAGTAFPRDNAFCCQVVEEKVLVEVRDTLQCGRHRTHPLVTGEPHVRFFAGAPVRDEGGLAVGALCVAADRPGALDEAQREALERLARHTAQLMELRRAALKLDSELLERTQAAEEGERRYRTLLDQLSGMVYRCSNDADWTATFVSQGCRALLGVDSENLLRGKPTYGSLIHADDSRMFRACVQAALEARRPYQCEYRVRHADGAWRWVFEQGCGVWDADGRLAYLEGYRADVTRRRLAEQASEHASQDLQAMLRAIPDLLFEFDAEGRYLRGLAGPTAQLWKPLAGRIGRTVAEVLPSEAAEQYMAGLREAAETGESRGRQYCLTLSQTECWFELSITKRPDTAAAPTFVVLARDITARKQAEQALRERERFARASLDALTAQVAILEADGLIIATNAAWKRFAVDNGAALLLVGEGANYLEVCDRVATGENDFAGAAGAVATAIRELVAGRRFGSFSLEYPCHSPTERRWFYCRITRFPGDGPVRVAVAHENVTAVHEAQDKLKAALDTFESLAFVAPVGIFRADSAGNFVYVNKRWTEITGIAAGGALDAGWRHVVHPEDLKALVTNWSRTVREGAPFRLEFRCLRPDLSVRWVVGDAVLVHDAHGERTIVGTVTDISEHVETNRVLRLLSSDLAKLSGAAFHSAIVRQLGGLLGCEFAFVSSWRLAKPGVAQMLAFLAHGSLQEDVVYPIAGSAIGESLHRGCALAVAREARSRYPKDRIIAEKRVEALAVAPLFDSGGRILGHLGVMFRTAIRDADRIKAMLALFSVSVAAEIERERDEARFQSLFESSPDAFVVTDARGVVIMANRQSEHLFGYRRDELVGQQIEVLLPEARRSGHIRRRERFVGAADSVAMAGDRPNLMARRKDGSLVPVEIVLHKIDFGDGPVVVAAARDISLRLGVERAIHEAHVSLDAISDGVFIFDPDMLAITYANQGAALQLGYERDELIGRTPVEIRAGSAEPEYRAMLERARRDKRGTVRYEATYRRKDGAEVPVEGTLQWVYPPGAGPRCVAVFRDNTERRQTLQRLERAARDLADANAAIERERASLAERVAERTAELTAANAELVRARDLAEDASRAKSAFLATMSHEIRTPMNGVIGTADVLWQSGLPQYQAALVETIRDSGLSLLAVINDVLDFSKIESGAIELEREVFSLAQCVESICESLRDLARSSSVELLLFIEPGLPGAVVGDRTRLRQILTNLIGNAIKFSAGQSRPGRVRLSVQADGPGRYRLSIADNGIGIPADAFEKIFAPFTQADSSTTRRFGGTGLGLSICKRLVDLMGGTIDVSSSVGVGSTFTVWLPFDVADADFSRPAPPDVRGLVCEIRTADPDLARNWRTYLEYAGARVLARAGQPAADEPPRLLIVDAGRECVDPPAALAVAAAHAGLLYVGRGRRRRVRRQAAGMATIDGDAMRMEAFLEAVAMAAGRITAADKGIRGIDVVPASASNAFAEAGPVLVAEDHATNQRVIQLQLSQLGLTADIAPDGRAALERWRAGNYAMLLTDLQMPEMDGFELAQAIRSEERPGEHIAIVAITANALASERERCLMAGMDDCLTKPMRLETLAAALRRCLRAPSRDGPPANDPAKPAGPAANGRADARPAIDPEVLRSLVGDDSEVISEMHAEYLAAAGKDAESIRAAAAGGDWKAVADAAHRLKSSSRSVGALALGGCCDRLEQAGKRKDGDMIRETLPEFEGVLREVIAMIEREYGE